MSHGQGQVDKNANTLDPQKILYWVEQKSSGQVWGLFKFLVIIIYI